PRRDNVCRKLRFCDACNEACRFHLPRCNVRLNIPSITIPRRALPMRLSAITLLTAVALAFSTTANAQPRPGGGGPKGGPTTPRGGTPGGLLQKLTLDQMAQLFTAAGFKAQAIDNNGTKMVQAILWTQDIFAGAFPEACEKDNSGCRAMKIFANLGKASV